MQKKITLLISGILNYRAKKYWLSRPKACANLYHLTHNFNLINKISGIKYNIIKPTGTCLPAWLALLCIAVLTILPTRQAHSASHSSTPLTLGGLTVNKSAISVSGTVTDEKGAPLPGVSVMIKGTKKVTTTDRNGMYQIDVPDAASVLVFVFVGYGNKEVSIGSEREINISLIPVTNGLDEVVVVGYGSQKKATVTGAISTISAKEITTATSSNVVNLLAGKLPGLRVTQRTSEPGDYATDYDIRGFGAPLVVIDGVPRGNLTRLDPNEIESVSVLKDAAAAVYGVKGGNGVILITTKRGNGKTQFTYTGTFGVSRIANSPDVLNAEQFATLTSEANVNVGNAPQFSAATIEQYRTGALPSTDWYNLVIRKYAPQFQHNISASGSSEKIRYFVSLGYFQDDGTYKSGDLNANRYNFRSNLTADLTKDLQAELFISGSRDVKNSPGESTGSIFQSIWTIQPTIPVYANNNPGYFSMVPDAAHAIGMTSSEYSGFGLNLDKIFNGTFALNYNVSAIKGLKLRALYAYDNTDSFNKNFRKAYNSYDYDAASNAYRLAGVRNSPTTLSQAYTASSSTTAQLSALYDRTFKNDHNIKALVLVEQRKQSGLAFNGSRQFSLDAVAELYAGNTTNQAVNSSSIIPNVNQGLVGRLNYDYKGKYLLEGSFRYDGSSKFAPGHRWGLFPAASVGWRISEESFLKGKLPFLDNLKLRASYGKLGDDASSVYQYLSGYNYPGSNYVLNGVLVNGLGFRGLANENLTWFTSKLTNIGLDVDLFGNKLHAEANYFVKKRDGLLATRNLSLPATVGAGLPQENLNSDIVKGFELALSYQNKIGEFAYNIGANVAFTRSKTLFVERAPLTNSYSNWRNNNIDRWNDNFFGYKVIGQFKSVEEIKAAPVTDGNGNRNVLPGDFIYEDFNNDGIIDDNDVQLLGRNSRTPQTTFGLTLGGRWKGFDFNALLQGGANFTVSYINSIALDAPLAWGRNGLNVFMDRWHRENIFDVNSAWVPGTYPSTRIKNGVTRPDSWNYRNSDFWMKDATYLRLKSLEIGYTLPASLVGKTGVIRSLRVFINGYNLVTWTGLNSLVDPEHTSDGYGTTYPITKNYNFGVNLNF